MVMKVYSPEFKVDAVALYLSDPDQTFEGVSKDLGVSRETLRSWVRAHRARGGQDPNASTSTRDGKTVAKTATREELEAELASARAELKAMRKENQKLAQERDMRAEAESVMAVVPRDVPYEVRTLLEIPEAAWQGDIAVFFAHGARQSGGTWAVGAQTQPDSDLLGMITLAGRGQDDAANAAVKWIRDHCAANDLELARVENFNGR